MSRSPTTLYIGSNVEQKTKPVQFELEDAKSLTIDLSAYCGIEGCTIISAAWSLLDPTPSVTLGTPTTTTKRTACLVTSADTGIGLVQVACTMSNGELIIQFFRCEVMDSELVYAPVQDYAS